jgi:hypothetical protein
MSEEFHNKKKSRKCSRDAVGSCDLEKEPSTDHCIYCMYDSILGALEHDEIAVATHMVDVLFDTLIRENRLLDWRKGEISRI